MKKEHKEALFAVTILFSLAPLSCGLSAEEAIEPAYSAEITWSTDKPATSQVEYGEDITQGYPQITELDPQLVTSHRVLIDNLKTAKTYHYRVRSKDANGQEMVGEENTLMIFGGGGEAPIQISDVKAGNIIAGGLSDFKQVEETRDQVIARTIFEKENEKERAPVVEVEIPAALQAEAPQKESLVKKEEPIEKTLIQRGGLLLARNRLQIEPSFTYAHVSTNRIAIQGFAILPILVIGEISADKVKRDIFIPAVSTRYGILDNLQWNLKVPYRYQFERISNTTNTETARSANGIGDIESGIFYQLLYEKGASPGVIAGFNVKSNTGKHPYGRDIGIGTGHWGLKPSLVWVKSSDPAILFGSLGYTWNIKRDIDGFGEVDPGDTFDYSLGLAFALNYQTALNFQIEQQITQTLRTDNTPVPASFTNAASFKTGFTYSLSKNLSLDVVTSYGLSEDAPDFVLEVRLPYTF